MQLEIEENFPGLKGDDSPLSEGQTPFLIVHTEPLAGKLLVIQE